MRAAAMCCGKKVDNALDGLTVDPSVISSLKSGVSERRGKKNGLATKVPSRSRYGTSHCTVQIRSFLIVT
jgi:hypothetical protein